MIARRARMTSRHERINDRFIVCSPRIIQRAEIWFELFKRFWAGNHARDETICEDPCGRKLQQRETFFLGVIFERLCNHERFFAPFGLHETTVVTRGARALGQCSTGFVFSGQHAACDRRIRRHTDAVKPACRKDFNLRQAI